MFQLLRLTGPPKRCALDLLDEFINAIEDLWVSAPPVEIILPGMFGKDALHSISSRSAPPPDSSSAMKQGSALEKGIFRL